MHRKDWIAPDLTERGSDSDKILHYSSQDYIIGESSQGMLQRIAHRLNNGPSPAQVQPEPDTSDLESEMAEMSTQFLPAELDSNSFAIELDAGPPSYLNRPANHFQGETMGSTVSEETSQGFLSGPFNAPQGLPADTEHASPSGARQVTTAGRKWEGGFFSS